MFGVLVPLWQNQNKKEKVVEMGKTHEALKRAEKEYQKNLIKLTDEPQPELAVRAPDTYMVPKPSSRYHHVKTRLITSFPEGSIKTILITGIANKTGTTTTAVGFAKTLARDCKLNVLLIDANLRNPKLHNIFNIHYNEGLRNLLSIEEQKKSLSRKVGRGNLHVIPCGGGKIAPLTLFESDRFDNFLDYVRKDFAYVILDAPPVNGYDETKIMSSKVDGVILVIESGKTRRPVAIRAKQELEEAGAKVLGIILNRRKYYIPEWIYKRL